MLFHILSFYTKAQKVTLLIQASLKKYISLIDNFMLPSSNLKLLLGLEMLY